MEQVNVTQAARQLSDLLNRVAYQGASFELTRGGRRIARLVPAGPPKRVRVSELNDIFAHIPKLGDDADAFERDIADAQSAIVPDRDPWED
jgi:prevent-host-death family protein